MNKKRRSQKQEKSVAKDLIANVVIASGAFWGSKADVRNSIFLVECKTTEKDYYNVTSKIWEKIKEEAIRDSLRIPLLVVDLHDKERYVIFNPLDFEKYPNCIIFNKGEINKQYRFRGYENYDLPVKFYLKGINYVYSLIGMKIDEFLDFYKEELEV